MLVKDSIGYYTYRNVLTMKENVYCYPVVHLIGNKCEHSFCEVL